jgi:long-chain acyl-CoA synthetase
VYPGLHAVARADQPAFIMAQSGESVTFDELEARSNRLAHLLRSLGLERLDHYAILTENYLNERAKPFNPKSIAALLAS